MKTVLVIDNDELFRLTLGEWLGLQGFQSITAHDGFEGIRLAQILQPNLILCDLDMPEIDGVEVLRLMQSDLAIAHIPFFFLTSAVALERKTIEHVGARGVLPKGGILHELRQTLTLISP
ncbi:MAG TPA: response regulator [Crinalium sp.]|jgi:CheY-like chemotaxis protein